MQHENTSTDSEGSRTQSIAEEVQASAQIVDNEEILESPDRAFGWLPLCLQDTVDGKWEISVIQQGWKNSLLMRTEAQTGEAFIPFGGGCHTKIILFGSDEYANKLPKSQAYINWGMKVAEEFAMMMNNQLVPAFPEVEEESERRSS